MDEEKPEYKLILLEDKCKKLEDVIYELMKEKKKERNIKQRDILLNMKITH
jgi:hypothetical protein